MIGLTRSEFMGGTESEGGAGAEVVDSSARNEVSGVVGKLIMAPSLWRISLPRRGVRQEGIIKNEWVNRSLSSLQGMGPVVWGLEGRWSIPITETWEGFKDPEKEVRTE